ncbi:leucine--tRNA (Leu) ligase [Parastagonospora nodorum]|nr:leucine--tRNA (Leu) ligase [Parastagonospora nodorum]
MGAVSTNAAKKIQIASRRIKAWHVSLTRTLNTQHLTASLAHVHPHAAPTCARELLMVRFSLQRISWRGVPGHTTQPCRRAASHWAAQRRQRAEGPALETLTAKWQPHWDKLEPQWNQLRNNDKGRIYVLPMFPYPSGTMHLGHLRVYTISDVLARFKHMQGYNVLHPIGWDAFGLPAENAAIERGIHPEKWTLQNIESMKAQIKVMGGRWDWDAELRTCDPDFYKHTQRIFLMLHQRGLAYQAESLVNYDPVDKTVLANEQVDANGCSWRSGAKVDKLMLKQWFLKIKEYQEPLLSDLAALAHNGRWPEKVLAMQRNWIGRSQGATIGFDVHSTATGERHDAIDVFTTRADTLFGVQYIALSCKHPIVQHEALGDARLRTFIDNAKHLSPDSKEGYLLQHTTARNPIAERVSGVESNVPVYVAPYVLDDYGSGAVMGVPGHDTRDHAFWRANAGNKPIRVVVGMQPGSASSPLIPESDHDKPVTDKGYIVADIDGFNGLSSDEAMHKVVAALQESGKRASITENWRLRDWLISRQRYWGTPIPIVHCSSCGAVPVPEQDLPVKLPNLPDTFFDGRKGNPLAEDPHWKKTDCPKCGAAAERETDTMDTFMDSSWYFFRFLDPKNENALLDPHKANKGMPVDLYVGGVEHAILHLLYARFISKFLASTATWPEGTRVNGEPFRQLITQGMVHGETFTNPENGRFLRPDELDLTVPSAPCIKANGLQPHRSYEKMSKSKYNGVDPGATIAMYGVDATRAHMLFQAPVGDVLEWDAKKITGVQRWLQRILRLSTISWVPEDNLSRFEIPEHADMTLYEILKTLAQREVLEPSRSSNKPTGSQAGREMLALLTAEDRKLWIKTQQIIASVKLSYSETYSLNTIVSDLMTLTNTIHDSPQCSAVSSYLKWHSMAHLIRMTAPIAPGVAEEAWHLLNGSSGPRTADDPRVSRLTTVFAAGFPLADFDIIPRLTRTTKCVVQIDGKRKFDVEIEKGFDGQVSKDCDSKSRWVLEQIIRSDQGQEWLHKKTGKIWGLSATKEPHARFEFVPSDWNVIIVNDGKLCNLVSPKKKKTHKCEHVHGVRDRNESAAVSPGVHELGETALNQDSDERKTVASNKNMARGLEEDNRPSKEKAASSQKLKDVTGAEQSERFTAPETTIKNNALLLSSMAPSVLPVQEVHDRVNALMATLPNYLRPHYVPPQVLSVRRPALVQMLRKAGRISPKDTRVDHVSQYEEEVAAFHTPVSIAPEYLVIERPLHDMHISTRRHFVKSYNAIFPEQLMLLAHVLAISPHTSAVLAVQRQSIMRKLNEYRRWVNNEMRTREQIESKQYTKRFATVEELKVSLGIPGQELEYEKNKGGELGYLPRAYWKRGAARVQDVWDEIISLWALRTPRTRTDGDKKVKLAAEPDEEMMGDWTWLIGDDPSSKSADRSSAENTAVFKWQ